MNLYKTRQESFWAGSFGDKYQSRNIGKKIIASNYALFSKILSNVSVPLTSFIEFGAGTGNNLKVIQDLCPDAQMSALEINKKAVSYLKRLRFFEIFQQSLLTYMPKKKYDFVLSKGLLIHINPDALPSVYNTIYKSAKKYICLVEYYNPKPIQITYRGYKNRLFKRDFAGEMLDRFPDLELIQYGFCYHRDSIFPQDDIAWFLLKKTNNG
jgi:spore coat polysaccharide biosynthesis protein SpsF